ncbi:MAG: methylated-DNA--[protein]-cysteine S-methyltransferase [Pseudomonadota bacterium]|nr:methylated-DNA--[protein]-cysteine S-methyltransferase [Pseudomonadota bacterium]
MSDYDRIAKAILYISQHVTAQPTLDDIAAHVALSPFHFQRLFVRWAGTTPKRFLQVLTLELGKNLLAESGSLLEVSDRLGLSSASRLHDHFVQLEAVTPGEYRGKGKDLAIEYGEHDTPFGRLFVAQTPRGVCRAAFIDDGDETCAQLAMLRKTWPLATYVANARNTALVAELLSLPPAEQPQRPLSLHVAGTNFQVAVWRALLRIPAGSAVTYSQIAKAVGTPAAVRAAGTAIGANPVAFVIPCHRVIQQSGALGGYRWGLERKQAMQVRERLYSRP